MNLIFVNCTADTFTPQGSGAIATWIWEMCRCAQRTGMQPLVISRKGRFGAYPWPRLVLLDYPALPRVRGVGRIYRLQMHLTGWQHIRQARYADSVVRAILAADGDRATLVLHNDPELAVYLRRRLPRTTIIHIAHNTNRCALRFRRRFASAVDAAFAVSDYCAAWNSDHFQASVRTLYNGVDLERFSPSQPASDLPLINFVGRTDASKGADLLLEAAKLLTARTNQFAIQIIGANHYDHFVDDPFQRRLQSLQQALQHNGVAVRLVGWVDRQRLPDELRQASINCVPARWDEPFGLTTLEGMACGLATVASRTGGTPEVVGDSALLFDRENVHQLAAHLQRLLEDAVLRKELATKARLRAESFSWGRTWDSLNAAVSSLPVRSRAVPVGSTHQIAAGIAS